jgi:tetratricopeptide (TPR) repeat protein
VLADIADRYRKSEAGAQARFYIAQTYRDQGKTEEARKAFLSVIERFPASQRAKDAKAMVFSSYWDKAMEFQKANDLSGAVEVWKQAYEYAADSRMKAEVLCIIEGTLLCLNRYEEVHKYAQMAYKLEPGSLGDWREGIRYYDAIACYRAGDYDAAVPILREIAATANDAETRQGIEAILQNIKSRRKKQ